MSSPRSEASAKPRAPVVCTTGEEGDCDDLDLRLSRSWLRLGAAAVFAGQGMVFSLAVNMTPPEYGSLAYWLVHAGLALSAVMVMVFLGGPLLRSTWRMILDRRLSIEGLFLLSLAGAFFGSLVSTLNGAGAVYYEVVAIVVAVYTVGRMVSERSQGKLLTESDRLRERYDAVLLVEGNAPVSMPLAEITPGSRVRVLPGAPFTVDGVVLEGSGYVEETALTGEPLPVVRRAGDRVRAGTWSLDGSFDVRAERVLGEREIDTILNTLEGQPGRPSELQTQANELIRGFLPLVAGVSIATAIYWAFLGTWTEAVLNSMAVLLVACPCALGLATPVAVWQGLFRLSTRGLVSRNGDLLDALAQTRQLFFDKTGTLSESRLVVSDFVVATDWRARRNVLMAAIHAVQVQVPHPVAKAFVRRFGDEAASLPGCDISGLHLLPGRGVSATVRFPGGDMVTLIAGERALLPEHEQAAAQALLSETAVTGAKAVFIQMDGKLAAVAILGESLRDGLDGLFAELETLGVRSSVLTGDPSPQVVLPPSVAVESGLSGSEKEDRVRRSLEAGERPVFIGDGINDAPALHAAAASIAMDEGADLARSAASGQLLGGNLGLLPWAIRESRAMRRRLKGNLIYAASYNTVGMALAATGHLHPVAAAVIMLASSFFVTVRALRFSGDA